MLRAGRSREKDLSVDCPYQGLEASCEACRGWPGLRQASRTPHTRCQHAYLQLNGDDVHVAPPPSIGDEPFWRVVELGRRRWGPGWEWELQLLPMEAGHACISLLAQVAHGGR